MVRAGERGIQPHSVCNYYNSLASPAGRPANAAEQRCAGTFVHGMQLKSSAERLTASHDMHPCILCLLVIGGKSPSLRSLAVQGFGSFDPLCLCCVLPRSASMYRATQAPGRQAGEGGGKKRHEILRASTSQSFHITGRGDFVLACRPR